MPYMVAKWVNICMDKCLAIKYPHYQYNSMWDIKHPTWPTTNFKKLIKLKEIWVIKIIIKCNVSQCSKN